MKQILVAFFISFIQFFSAGQETNTNEFQEVYIVIADTSQKYVELHEKMLCLSEKLLIPIDTMGRGYDPVNDIICLPIDDKDEIYAGDYFPRRYPSESISIEHLDFYINHETKMKCLVVGIYEEQKRAKQRARKTRKYSSRTYVLRTKLYMGCMH